MVGDTESLKNITQNKRVSGQNVQKLDVFLAPIRLYLPKQPFGNSYEIHCIILRFIEATPAYSRCYQRKYCSPNPRGFSL